MLPQHYIPISNSPFSKIKRAITWSSFSVNKDGGSVSINTSCHFFESDSKEQDGYGKELSNQEVRPFSRILTATNSTLVNPASGLHATFVQDLPEVRDESGNITQYQTGHYIDSLGATVDTPMGQFDYFFAVIMNSPVKVYPLILQILQTEDAIYHAYDQ